MDARQPRAACERRDNGVAWHIVPCSEYLLTRHAFERGGSHPAYVVSIDSYDGFNDVRATTVLTHIDATRRARLRKQPNPRPL